MVSPTLEVNECTLALPAHPVGVGAQALLIWLMCVICACWVVIIQFYMSFLHISDEVSELSLC